MSPGPRYFSFCSNPARVTSELKGDECGCEKEKKVVLINTPGLREREGGGGMRIVLLGAREVKILFFSYSKPLYASCHLLNISLTDWKLCQNCCRWTYKIQSIVLSCTCLEVSCFGIESFKFNINNFCQGDIIQRLNKTGEQTNNCSYKGIYGELNNYILSTRMV